MNAIDIIEVHSFTITVSEYVATEAGALDGYAIDCTCGEHTTSSLLTLAQEHAHKHAQFHVHAEQAFSMRLDRELTRIERDMQLLADAPQHCCDSDCDRFATVVLHIEETLYSDEAYDAAFCAEHAAETLHAASESVEFSATAVRELV